MNCTPWSIRWQTEAGTTAFESDMVRWQTLFPPHPVPLSTGERGRLHESSFTYVSEQQAAPPLPLKGKEFCIENVFQTGVLEKQDGRWVHVLMHGSYPVDKIPENYIRAYYSDLFEKQE